MEQANALHFFGPLQAINVSVLKREQSPLRPYKCETLIFVLGINSGAGGVQQCGPYPLNSPCPPVMPVVRMEGHWFAHYCQLADKSWPA